MPWADDALLTPKIAVLYVSLLPQFIAPERGSVLLQSLLLGSTQIAVSVTVNTLSAGSIAVLARRPGWAAVQRWLKASVLAALAVRMATETRR